MNKAMFCRARILFGVGAATVLIGLTAACDASAPVSAPATTATTPGNNAGPTNSAAPNPSSASVPSPPASVPAPAGNPVVADTQPSHHPTPDVKPVPVLGTVWGLSQHGYGTAMPSEIDNGGDPTGLVTGVHWRSWGGPVAIGSGQSYDPGDGPVAASVQRTATVEAFNLGVCHGKLMYQAIDWYFPETGGTFDPHRYINICTGEYVGSH